nr:uncharacterized protein LOC127313126 [Lolium perenne]
MDPCFSHLRNSARGPSRVAACVTAMRDVAVSLGSLSQPPSFPLLFAPLTSPHHCPGALKAADLAAFVCNTADVDVRIFIWAWSARLRRAPASARPPRHRLHLHVFPGEPRLPSAEIVVEPIRGRPSLTPTSSPSSESCQARPCRPSRVCATRLPRPLRRPPTPCGTVMEAGVVVFVCSAVDPVAVRVGVSEPFGAPDAACCVATRSRALPRDLSARLPGRPR